MENVKLAIIYYSSTGTNYQMAKWAEAGAKRSWRRGQSIKGC